MSDFAEIARGLWRDARGTVLDTATQAADLTRAWGAGGGAEDLRAARALAHQLAGSVGSYALALRGSGGEGDPDVEAAGAAARQLDLELSASEPDPERALTAAEDLLAAIDRI